MVDELLHGGALRSAADVEGLAEALVHDVQRNLGLLDRGGQDDLGADHFAAQVGEGTHQQAERGVHAAAPLVHAGDERILSGTELQPRPCVSSAAQTNGAGPTGAKGSCSSSSHGSDRKDGGRAPVPITEDQNRGSATMREVFCAHMNA